jgi:DNA repair photolyase
LELFRRYTPGMLYVQTRSPLIVLALPVFKALGQHVSITIGVETPLEEAVQQYTPGLPRVAERLKTATALRRFGIEVNLQVYPVLPYGDWKKDAESFAQILIDHADHIYVNSITDGTDKVEKKVSSMAAAKKLAMDRKFHWLRPDAANPLITEIERLAPEKLRSPERGHLKDKQMKIFAA